jgi:hypothetical protein
MSGGMFTQGRSLAAPVIMIRLRALTLENALQVIATAPAIGRQMPGLAVATAPTVPALRSALNGACLIRQPHTPFRY